MEGWQPLRESSKKVLPLMVVQTDEYSHNYTKRLPSVRQVPGARWNLSILERYRTRQINLPSSASRSEPGA